MRRHLKQSRKRRFRIFVKPIFALAVLISLLVIFDFYIKPIVDTIAITKAKALATNSINNSIVEELSSGSISYGDLIQVNKKGDSSIASIETNTIGVNNLKSKITLATQNALSSSDSSSTNIPLGTLLGSRLLAGRGPDIPINIALSGSTSTEFKSKFTSAGINQTKHSIYILVSTNISVLLPLYDLNASITTNIPISETILVGDVPRFYAGIGAGTSVESLGH